jgi:23S rRNA (cytosine1962-C5)-methyltransferase
VRTLALAKSGLNKLRSHSTELKSQDLEDSIRSLTPGEWCFFSSSGPERWLGFVNPLIDDKFTSIHILQHLPSGESEFSTSEDFIRQQLGQAYAKRQRFTDYKSGARIVYGANDGLPGLIVDTFENASVIQINSAGLDIHRDFIKTSIAKLTGRSAFFLDNENYRSKESLPSFPKDVLPDLRISENELKFSLRSEVMQKVGFYYDHRENRRQLSALLKRLDRPLKSGVDLFCYAGAWGMASLRAGVEHVDFVDQGDLSQEIQTGLELNSFHDQGAFHRSDVFKFLDQKISERCFYDLVLCDPPAFAKSLSQKKEAMEGYSKLHRKVFKVAAPGAILSFSSCTHYVEHQEFQKNILDAAAKENKKVQLLYCGIQGWDHPVSSLEERSNYIKSYFYLMES